PGRLNGKLGNSLKASADAALGQARRKGRICADADAMYAAPHAYAACPDRKIREIRGRIWARACKRPALRQEGRGTMDMKTRHPTLGSLLRGLRARSGWTLKEMSERIEIPVSTLSKVEHDRLTLTYDKLLQLSQRLNIRMAELFADPASETEVPVTARRSLGNRDDAVHVKTKNYDYYYLCPELRRKRMIPVYTRIRAKSLEEFGELVRHPGEEYIYVVEGAI